MRKILSTLAVVCMLIAFIAAPTAAAAGDWYNFGGSFEAWNYNDEIDTSQFKLQCTNENNVVGGAYDTSLFVDQVLGGWTSMAAWGGNLYAPPASVIDAEEQYDEDTAPNGYNGDNFWWYVNGQGSLIPAGNISQVLSFEAPSAGTWVRIAVQFDGGIAEGNQAYPQTDGVTWSVLLNDSVLSTSNTGNAFVSEVFITEDEILTAGDLISVVVDGNEFADYDTADVAVYIAIWDDVSQFWGEFNWGNTRIAGKAMNPLTQIGTDKFLPMSSDTTNQGSNFDVATLHDCIWSGYSGTTATAWTWYGPAYIPDPDFAAGGTKDEWWGVFGDGRLMPEGMTVAALKWVAPETGVYNLYANVKAGQLLSYYGSETADGTGIYIYNGSTQLFYVDAADLTADYYFESYDIALNEGDELYFIADPKLMSDNVETSQWIIDIETASVEAPIATATPIPTTAEATPTSPVSPATSDTGNTFAIMAIIALAAASLVFARKFSTAK